MRVIGIFRGFPGLGRVVSGAGILKELQNSGHDVIAYTYMAGRAVLQDYQISLLVDDMPTEEDIFSIGINPVGVIGPKIIDVIVNENPDIVIIDGEPLLLSLLSKIIPPKKIVALLNPSDYLNNNVPRSTNIFFSSLYQKAGTVIIHGIDNSLVKDENLDCNEVSKIRFLNTIIRPEILCLNRNLLYKSVETVGVILGGGAYNASANFFNSTIDIGQIVFSLAKERPDVLVSVFCNDERISCRLKDCINRQNIRIYNEYVPPSAIYENDFFIVRGGRNTISELLYLNKRGIVFTTKDLHRHGEQGQNAISAERISKGFIKYMDINIPISKIIDVIWAPYSVQECEYNFIPGNATAINILSRLGNESE